jgi:hypothetical protein
MIGESCVERHVRADGAVARLPASAAELGRGESAARASGVARGALELAVRGKRERLARASARGRDGVLRMKSHAFVTEDRLRRATPAAMIISGGGWPTPHPGWGVPRVAGMLAVDPSVPDLWPGTLA